VFDMVHEVMLGPAARQGYHHESLANSVVVRMIRRYIADHRSIFRSAARGSSRSSPYSLMSGRPTH
jgi:hypothetical protein